MQVVYGDASNIYLTAQKRLIRVVEGQTQATPFSGYIDPSLRGETGGIRVPTSTDEPPTYPLKRSANAFVYEGSIVPGTCLVRTTEEDFAIAAGRTKERVFGLLGQWVGGTFDNLKSSNEISAWQGPDSVYDLLAPAVNTEASEGKTLQAAVAEYNETPGQQPVYLYAGTDGRLAYLKGTATVSEGSTGAAKEHFPVAEVIGVQGEGSVIRVRLLV